MTTYYDKRTKQLTEIRPARKFSKDLQSFFITVFGEKKALKVTSDGRVEMEIDLNALTPQQQAELKTLIEGL